MNVNPTLMLLLLCACGQTGPGGKSDQTANLAQSRITVEETEAQVLRALGETGGATWVNWPADQRYFGGTDKPCLRVSEQAREAAITLLSDTSARPIDGKEYENLTGRALPDAIGAAYLLRGFSTSNSTAHVSVTGDIVTVHNEALGGLFNIRRHPCVAILNSAPTTVYTVVAYDL